MEGVLSEGVLSRGVLSAHPHTHMRTNTRTRAPARTRTRTRTRTRARAHTHTHTHTLHISTQYSFTMCEYHFSRRTDTSEYITRPRCHKSTQVCDCHLYCDSFTTTSSQDKTTVCLLGKEAPLPATLLPN